MKTGIAADNYKLDKFKQELNARGYTDLTIIPLDLPNVKDISVIQVEVSIDKIDEIRRICELVETYFIQRN